jgi:hypothetical protein
MTGSFDFTGQDIETTYQRVLQTDGLNVYDGTGSLLPLNLDSASFATTGSNIFIGNQIITGSISVTNSVTASYFVGIIDGGTF